MLGSVTAAEGPVAAILVVPADVAMRAESTARFAVRALDGKGRAHGDRPVQWTLEGLAGTIDPGGVFSPADRQNFQTGTVTARVGELSASSRVRVFPRLPWVWDFESTEAGKSPAQWVGASGRFLVAEKDGNRALFQGPVERGLDRATIFFGPSSMSGYTIEADVMGGQRGRRIPTSRDHSGPLICRRPSQLEIARGATRQAVQRGAVRRKPDLVRIKARSTSRGAVHYPGQGSPRGESDRGLTITAEIAAHPRLIRPAGCIRSTCITQSKDETTDETQEFGR